MVMAGEEGSPFLRAFSLPPQISLYSYSNQPGGNKRLKQYDARGGGKVDAADFALMGMRT